jgi:hypothetical protein
LLELLLASATGTARRAVLAVETEDFCFVVKSFIHAS